MKTHHLPLSVEPLLKIRAVCVGKSLETVCEWVEQDPVIGFLTPILAVSSPLYWANVARFELLRQLAHKIMAEFKSQDIPVILLKGILFAETLFEDPGLRSMNDLDLLVRHQDVQRAMARLQKLGIAPNANSNEWILYTTLEYESEAAWLPGECKLVDERKSIVDLHWHLSPDIWIRHGRTINMESVWSRAIPLPHNQWHSGYALSNIDTLAYLCLHLALHGLQPLRAYLDVDQFVRQQSQNTAWNWDVFAERVSEWQIRSAAYHVLSFAHELMGTPVPSKVIQALDPGLAARGRIARLIRAESLLEYPGRTWGMRYPALVKFALIDRLSDMLAVARRVIFPAPAWRKRRYQGNTSLWYHWKHGLKVIARGD